MVKDSNEIHHHKMKHLFNQKMSLFRKIRFTFVQAFTFNLICEIRFI